MHLQNLIHGDIKPGSIFVHHDATCRLGSFGLSSSRSDAFSQTRLAVSGGTPAYMSPEHTTRTQRPVDSRSDLYSLGMVLYELLTGRLPFELGRTIRPTGRTTILPRRRWPRTRYARTCRECCRPSS
jgi:serine/threonine protein kinase